MSTLKVDTIQDTNAVEMYLCKAWVNFDGSGTVAINASGNVSSITDVSNGKFTVNFSTNFSDTDYAVVVGPTAINATAYVRDLIVVSDTKAVSGFTLFNQHNQNYGWYDNNGISAAVFR